MEKDRRVQGNIQVEQSKTENSSPPSTSQLHAKHQHIINERLPIGIVESSLDGRYIDVNDEFCRMLGYQKQELLQRGISDVTYEEDYQIDSGLYSELAAGALPHYKIEKRFVRKDGQTIWADVTQSAIRDADGNPRYLVGIILDTTERHLAEDALRESERKFSLIYDKLPFAATLTRPRDGFILDVNETFEKIFGYSKQEVIGKTLLELGLVPDAGVRERILAELHEQYSVRGLELELSTKSNGTRIFLANLDLVEIRGETYILQTDQDITERKRLEEDLRASELLYREIAGSIPGGAVYVLDKDLRYLVAEGSPTQAYGLSREAVEGRTVSEIFTGALKEQVENNLRRAFAGEIVSSETLHNGRVYWSQYAMMNEALGYAIIVTLDITERKQVLEALRESEERFRAILNQATAGIVRKDTVGTLLFVNDAFCNMVGYTLSELVLEGRTCWDLTHPDDVEENKRLFTRMIQDGIPFQMERRLIRSDGSILWANVSVSPIKDASGTPISAVGVEVDITARKQAEASLRQLNLELESRVEERTAELQEMNQVLQKSRRRLQVLSQRLVQVQEDERRSLARELHDQVGQSLIALNLNLTIIQSELSTGDTAQLSTRLTDSIQLVTQVIKLVRDVMSNLRPTILDDYGLEAALQTYVSEFQSRYGLPVRFEKPTHRIPRLENSIETTLLRISQEALTNIARHAQASQAVLSLQLDDKQVYLTIEDDGIGIPSLEGAKRPHSHGLKIMRERAEALEGTLSIHSAPGKGTKIEVIIPLPAREPYPSSPE